MDLDVGIGIGEDNEFTPVIHAEVCLDRYKPKERLPVQFIQADAHNLPFRNKCFETAFAFNVIEHVQDPYRAIREIVRVSETARFRQDHLLHFGNYLEDSHLWLALPGLRFVKYPRTRIGISLCNWLRRLWDLRINGRYFVFFVLRYFYHHGIIAHNILCTYEVKL